MNKFLEYWKDKWFVLVILLIFLDWPLLVYLSDNNTISSLYLGGIILYFYAAAGILLYKKEFFRKKQDE